MRPLLDNMGIDQDAIARDALWTLLEQVGSPDPVTQRLSPRSSADHSNTPAPLPLRALINFVRAVQLPEAAQDDERQLYPASHRKHWKRLLIARKSAKRPLFNRHSAHERDPRITFHPKITPRSRRLDQRQLTEGLGLDPRAPRTLLMHARQADSKLKLDALRAKREEELAKVCTFAPHINKDVQSRDLDIGGLDAHARLYNDHLDAHHTACAKV